jgi:hypothetical protein
MTIAKGTAKQVGYKKESAFGTLAGASGGKLLRRVTASFNLTKDTYESGEIRTDRQISDYRHGVRKAEGTLNGELSPASYADFMAAVVAKEFAAGASATAAIEIVQVGEVYGLNRSTGDFVTDGFKVGTVVRLTGAGLSAGNVGVNLLVTHVTDTVLTVSVVNGDALVEEGPVADVTVATVGKTTQVPTSGHTDNSYTIEEWYSDIAQSEVYTGMKVKSVAVKLPATGLSTVDIGFAGKDMAQAGGTQYFSSPAAQNTNGIFAAVNGVMLVDGAPVALVTTADFSIERATENATAVGSNSVAEIFTGRIRVTGNLSVYFQDGEFRSKFDNEVPVSIVLVLTTDSAKDSEFVTFTLPKVKLGSFTKNDGELGVVAATSFQALLNEDTSAGLPVTTIAIQDSAVA